MISSWFRVVGADMTFCDAMKFARERRGLSARSLSKASDLSDSYMSKVEAGQIKPNLDAFARIVRVLELNDLETLFLLRMIGENNQIQSINDKELRGMRPTSQV